MSKPRILVVAVLSLAMMGCSSRDGRDELVVSAASSLTDAFETLAEDFEAEHPGVEVLLNLDSSATLAEQITSGAPVDVFASADEKNMDRVVESVPVTAPPIGFASNEVVIVTRPGNDYRVVGPADLERVTDAGEVVALCAVSAPCGELAGVLLTGVELDNGRVTRAPNARATLRAVTRGDAAAAVVYRTDALAAVEEVEIVEAGGTEAPATEYLAVALADGPAEVELAEEFVGMLTSPEGREVLDAGGFSE